MRRQKPLAAIVGLLGALVWLSVPLVTSGCLGGAEDGYAIHVYTRSDACGAAATWADYLGGYAQEDLRGTAIYGDPGLAEAVKRDRLGIGFNNLNYVYDMQTGLQLSGLRVVPVDIDGNGSIDVQEDFYATKDQLTQAIADGLYPSPPARNLHFVTRESFGPLSEAFIRWVLIEGQQYCDEVGYIPLTEAEVSEELAKLGDAQPPEDLDGKISISGAWALYPMTVRWAEEFRKAYPRVTFDISAGGAGKGMADALAGLVDIGMVSRQIYPVEIESGAFWASVTRDAVVPVMNAENPLLEEILTTGMQRQALADIWITASLTDWRDISN